MALQWRSLEVIGADCISSSVGFLPPAATRSLTAAEFGDADLDLFHILYNPTVDHHHAVPHRLQLDDLSRSMDRMIRRQASIP